MQDLNQNSSYMFKTLYLYSRLHTFTFLERLITPMISTFTGRYNLERQCYVMVISLNF